MLSPTHFKPGASCLVSSNTLYGMGLTIAYMAADAKPATTAENIKSGMMIFFCKMSKGKGDIKIGIQYYKKRR